MNTLKKTFGISFAAAIIVCAITACPILPKPDPYIKLIPVSVTGVSLKTTTSLVVGGTETLYARIDPTNAANKNVTWSSNNNSVATVSAGGAVTAVAAGTATITVRTVDGGKTANCTVNVVTTSVAVTGVTLNKTSTNLTVGEAEDLIATIAPSTATNQNVTWSSSNTSVATVSAGGEVKAVAAGTATITVKTADGNKTAACSVTVTAATYTFTSIAEMAAWLSAQPNNSDSSPYNIKLNVSSLGGDTYSTTGSAAKALYDNRTKYVNLDLSGSTFTVISGTGFALCSNLTSVTIGNSVTNISYGAFYYCSSLSAINVASGNNTFTSEDGVVYNKNKTILYHYPPAKTGSSFTIPNSVTDIRLLAFGYCKSLTSMTIPDSVNSIGETAFNGCTSLTAINVGTTNTAYSSQDGVLYDKNKTTIICYPAGKTGSSFTIPNSVTGIGKYAFCYCTYLASVTIPSSVISIGASAFGYCTNLASVIIPSSVTSIGASAFHGCTILASVTFQGPITSDNLHIEAFGPNDSTYIGDLRDKYLAGGPGTYKRPNTGTGGTWTKQP